MSNTKVFSQTIHSNIAKLLSKESIEVVFGNYSTASFDIKSRILKMPDWKEVPEVIYSLFIGHEVGHALFSGETLVKNLTSGGKCRTYKTIMNIVEDCRIEKMIQSKYPGLVPVFKLGYRKLLKFDSDFGRWNELAKTGGLLDRLNIHFKVGNNVVKVDFLPEEMEYVNAINACETEDDVIRVTELLYEKFKSSQVDSQKSEDFNFDIQDENSEETSDDEASGENSNEASKENTQETPHGKSEEESDSDELSEDKNSEASKNSSPSNDENAEEDSEKTDSESSENSGADSKNSQPDNLSQSDNAPKKDDFECTTQEEIDECIDQLSKDELSKNKYDLKGTHIILGEKEKSACFSSIIPLKTIKSKFYNYNYWRNSGSISQQEFKTVKTIIEKQSNSMTQAFNIKKRAAEYRRERHDKTGILDMKKLHQYKFSEDLFKKNTIKKDGKSHAFLFLIDLSQSMINHITETLTQLYIFSDFCRKSGIPFEMYGFTDVTYSENYGDKFIDLFSKDKYIGRTFLLELATSKMDKKTYESIKETVFLDPPCHGNTPLNNALFHLIPIHDRLKKTSNADIVNTVILTDGGDNCISPFTWGVDNSIFIPEKRQKFSFRPEHYRDEFSSGLRENSSITKSLLEVYREITKSSTIGFFVSTTDSISKTIVSQNYDNLPESDKKKSGHYDYFNANITEMKKKIRNDGYAVSSAKTGYDELFYITNQTLKSVSALDIIDSTPFDKNAKISTILNSMKRTVRKSKYNTSLVSKIMDIMA